MYFFWWSVFALAYDLRRSEDSKFQYFDAVLERYYKTFGQMTKSCNVFDKFDFPHNVAEYLSSFLVKSEYSVDI